MKLKRRYLVVIVVVMVVMTAMVASVVVSSVQGSRIAYVAVSADRESYALGENVTFQLRPLTSGVDFTIGGSAYDPYGNHMYDESVAIARIPDNMDPYSVVDDSSKLNDVYSWSGQEWATIPIPVFSSSGGSLVLMWNGTIPAHDHAAGTYGWGQATAGYYLLYPTNFQSYWSDGSSGHTVKFYLDHSSVFYYGGLDVDFNFTSDGPYTIVDTTLTLPAGASPTTGQLTQYISSPYSPPSSSSYLSPFHNATVDLRPGEAVTVTVEVLGSESDLDLDALLVTDQGVYAFGFFHQQTYYSPGGLTIVFVQY